MSNKTSDCVIKEPFVRGKYRRAGIRRFKYAENVKFINPCYLPFEITDLLDTLSFRATR